MWHSVLRQPLAGHLPPKGWPPVLRRYLLTRTTVVAADNCRLRSSLRIKFGSMRGVALLTRLPHYSRSFKNLARQLLHNSYKSAFTGSQRPICESGATVGVRGFYENGCIPSERPPREHALVAVGAKASLGFFHYCNVSFPHYGPLENCTGETIHIRYCDAGGGSEKGKAARVVAR